MALSLPLPSSLLKLPIVIVDPYLKYHPFLCFQFRCLCCLHAVYSLPQVQQFVPPVHHAALVGLVNEFWRDHGTDNNEVSMIEQNRKVCLYLFIFSKHRALWYEGKPLA